MATRTDKERGERFPPVQVSLRFCSVCGANDRYRNLHVQSYHYGTDGKRCPGTVETITYEIVAEDRLFPGDLHDRRDQLDQQVKEAFQELKQLKQRDAELRERIVTLPPSPSLAAVLAIFKEHSNDG